MNEPVRVGVIGCGWWSTYAHLPALARNTSAVIAGIADPNESNRKHAADTFGVKALFETPEELIAEGLLDAVVVAVPPSSHYACARLALTQRLHVLLEKPMVLNVEDGLSLLQLADANNVGLLIGYPWHYNEHVLQIRSLISSGGLGSIEHVSCLYASIAKELYRGNPEQYRDVLQYRVNAPTPSTYSDPSVAGGGQGTNQITHAAALLMWLTGLTPEKVSAFTANHGLEVDLIDVAAIQFSEGALGALSSTGALLDTHEEILEYRIFGGSGHLTLDLIQGTTSIFSSTGRVDLPRLAPELRYPEWAPVDNLIEVASRRNTNGSPPSIGVATVAFLDALYRSAAAGGDATAVRRTLPRTTRS